MVVNQIIEINKKKSKISFDTGEVIALYRSEIYRYELREGKEFPDQEYRILVDEVLTKRAKQRLMYVLQKSDQTEHQLYIKLKNGYYPEESIDTAIAYVKSFGYVDDYEYAKRYIEQKVSKMSIRQIELKLTSKGISREIIKEILEDTNTEEEEVLTGLLLKKKVDYSTISREDKQKLCAHFIRKGFTYDSILKKIYELGQQEHLT